VNSGYIAVLHPTILQSNN